MNTMEAAAVDAAFDGAPRRTWDVPQTARIIPGSGHSMWDGLTVTHWTDDEWSSR